MNHIITQEVNEKNKQKIQEIIRLNKEEDGNIISLLQKIQEQYGYLSTNIMGQISVKLKIPLTEIYSIATFYTQFKFNPIGKYNIICCEGTACHVKGSNALLEYIETFLGIKSGEITEDMTFSIESVACLGCCAISPVCKINDKIYGNLTIKKIKNILNKLMKK